MELRATEYTLRHCQARRWSRAMAEVRHQMWGRATWPGWWAVKPCIL